MSPLKATQRIIPLTPALLPGGVDRRQALKLMAASLALATGACSRPDPGQAHPFVRMPEAGTGGEDAVFYATSFVRDGFAHGVLVDTREGRPIKIEGNPLHPASLGRTDAFAQASVLELWDPDRSQTPLRRVRAGQGGVTAAWSDFRAEWQARAAALRARQGEGLHLMLPDSTSPTLFAQLLRWLDEMPRMQLHRHAPLAGAAAENGALQAFGRWLRVVPDMSKASLVVALGCDPFSGAPDAVRCAADWAGARSASLASGRPLRLIAIETTPGLFGTRADERLALSPPRIDALVARLAASFRLAGAESTRQPADAALADFEARLRTALAHAGDTALLLPGAALTAETHARVHALNARLGAVGRTMRYIEPPESPADLPMQPLKAFVEAATSGEVDTLLVLGGNPAYNAPGRLGFGEALARVPFAVHAGLYDDETANLCRWHLPLSHDYEQWSDARAFDGTASLLQPAIAPMYDTRSVHELAAELMGQELQQGRELVRRQWRSTEQDDAEFEAFWRTSLRDGVVAGSAGKSIPSAPQEVVDSAPPPTPPLVAVFAPDPTRGDGRFANNAWLQELPHPFSKITWANAVMLGPATAAALGLQNGDVVSATLHGRSAEAPVWVLSTHAEGAATFTLGGGRRRAGRVGSGVGYDAYALQPAPGAAGALTLTRTGQRVAFARTQREMDQHNRKLAREVPAERPSLPAEPPQPSLYAGTTPPRAIPDATPPAVPGPAWGMVIDLDTCIGCNACTIACQAENNIPVVGAEQVSLGRVMHWIRIDHYEEARSADMFQPVPCMHCENAPCEIVCPVGATVHDSEGLNVQVYNRCVGTRFCSNNCPYKVRRFNFLAYGDPETESLRNLRNPDVTVRARGVMEKCTYCLQRITRARLNAEKNGRPLVDGDVVTACQGACPTTAIHFGNLADSASDVSRARASPRGYPMLGELNTRPRTTYLARLQPAKEPDA